MHFSSTAFTEAGGGTTKVLISFKFKASKSFTVEVISSLKELRSTEEDEEEEEEEEGGGVYVLTRETVFREYRTFALLSIIFKQSFGILSRKLPPAAELRES